ncbi:hypothetical protein BH09SUM1_BH09SUM1_12330 [soil metagenome]
MKVTFAPSAKRDLAALYNYLKRFGFERADKTMIEIRAAAVLLGDFPELGIERFGWPSDYRSRVVGQNIIVYQITDRVRILNVVDSRRDVERMFRKKGKRN